MEITEEMVELAATALCRANGKPFHDECDPLCVKCRKTAAFVLQAALTPAEPEIPVSEGMRRAGAMATEHMAQHTADFACSQSEAIYKAMVAQKLREEAKEAAPYGANEALSYKSCAACGCSYRAMVGHVCERNRRKGDAK